MPAYRAGAGAAGNPALSLRPQFITAYAVTDAPDLAETLADYARIAKTLGAEVQLELVLPEGKSPGSELAAAAEACAAAGLKPVRVIVCPAPYLKSVQPSGPWPEVVDLAHIYNQARKAFPDSAILGGMLSYFTELNRKRPPVATIDGVTCTTTPIVHAADDTSVMETLRRCRRWSPRWRRWRRGNLCTSGRRRSACGTIPTARRPRPIPTASASPWRRTIPRQKGLFAAAWTVGYAAAIADTAVATLALNHLAGPQGLAGSDGEIYPVFHVMAALCAAGGRPRIPLTVEGKGVAALAWRDGETKRLLVANLSPASVAVALPEGLAGTVLDAASFDSARRGTAWSTAAHEPVHGPLHLGPYAVLFATA